MPNKPIAPATNSAASAEEVTAIRTPSGAKAAHVPLDAEHSNPQPTNLANKAPVEEAPVQGSSPSIQRPNGEHAVTNRGMGATDKAETVRVEKSRPPALPSAPANGDPARRFDTLSKSETSISETPRVEPQKNTEAAQPPRVAAVDSVNDPAKIAVAKAGDLTRTHETPTGDRTSLVGKNEDQAKAPVTAAQNVAPSIVDRHLSGQTATLISKDPVRSERKGGFETVMMTPTKTDLATSSSQPAQPIVAPTQSVSQFAISALTPHTERATPPRMGADQSPVFVTASNWGTPIDPPAAPSNMPATPLGQVPLHRLASNTPTDIALDTPNEITWDVRGSGQSTQPAQLTPLTKAEMPPHIPRQVAEAIHRSPDKSVEVALNPVELGRVRMVLSATDAGINVSILADRPDTLDLMRRNIDDLGQSFAELGYEDIAFSFEHGDQAEAGENPDHPPESDIAALDVHISAASTPTAATPPRLSITPEGVDMRF